MKKILLLGSGELGREFVIAAKRAGQYVVACDRYDNAPAMQVADEREIFSMLDGDALAAPTLCNPMDYTLHGILQARILEWVAIPFSRGSSRPRD